MGPVLSEQVFRSALRRVVAAEPRMREVIEPTSSLESLAGEAEPPKLIDARTAEDATRQPRPVGEVEPAFGGFLDGVQRSFVAAWDGPTPIVAARVAAAIRARVARRLVRWGEPAVQWGLYANFSRTPREPWLHALPPEALVDVGGEEEGATGGVPHPLQVIERARAAVGSRRERLERALAREWCILEHAPLLVDGGIAGEDALAHSPLAVGVVKSHRTLYVTGPALEAVLALGAGERSRAFVITPRGHSSVLSWYLRLRSPESGGALWGLVRVEVADVGDTGVTERADLVSRWVLAERLPLALPDPRWDTMVYGVRGTEDYLRAIG